MMEYDRVRLKTAAKQAMKFQRPHPMLMTLLFTILVNIGTQIVSRILGAASGSDALSNLYAQALIEYQDPETAIQYAVLSVGPQRLAIALFLGVFIAGIITSLWTGLMRTGYAGFCLGMVRGQQPQTGALFSVFPQWASVLLTQFLAGLFRALWTMLLGVAAFVLIIVSALIFAESAPVLMLILFLLIYIAFLVGLVVILLRYAMVDFLIADQHLTGMDAIQESKRMMQGNTGRLFTLNLSFIGWYLLEIGIMLVLCIVGFLTFGPEIAAASGSPEVLATLIMTMLGFLGLFALASIAIGIFNLWLTPYITGAEALFYDWIRGVDSRPAGGYGYGPGGGWGQPYPPQQNHTGYTWKPTPGSTSGRGIGSGQRDNGNGPQPPQPPQQPPRPPKSPKDDPWD